MAPETRRAMIVEAAIPLILERGVDVTTREIASAAGIAEGTVFRAFSDKAELIDAAVERVMDPEEALVSLRGIDAARPLEEIVVSVVEILTARVERVVAFMGALGPRDHARHRVAHRREGHSPLGEATGAVTVLLEAHADELRVPVTSAAEHLRVLVVGSSVPFLRGDAPVDPVALADLIMHGIVREEEVR